MKKLNLFLAATAAVVLFFGVVQAQDPTTVDAQIYKTILENEYVRVFEVHFKPGAKIGTHSHPDHAAYVLSGGKLKLIYPDTAVVVEAQAGATFWIPAESHAAENVGDTDLRVLVLDVKLPKSDPPATADYDSTLDPAKVAPEKYTVLLENERMRLLKTHYEAGAKSPLHAHRPNVVYTLTDGKVRHTFKDGKSAEIEFSAGQALWREAEVHAGENFNTAAFEVLLAELKEPLPAPQPVHKH